MKKILYIILVLFAFCFTINHKVNAEENFDEDNINSISSSEIIPATTFEFMTFEELMNFYNAPITNEVNIKNSYYFSNFIMPEKYNQYDTCSLVSLSLLLGYYDTFYNGDFIDDLITYVDKECKTTTISAIYDGISDSSFQYKTWENNFTNNLPVPTKYFHDYLVDIAERNNIIEIKERQYSNGTTKVTCGGMSDFDSDQVLRKYLIENNISTNLLNLAWQTNVTSYFLLQLLEKNIPLRVLIKDYEFYYIQNGKIYGQKTSNTSHSIIAYGFIQNEYGTFLKTNFGYDNYGECYVNIDYVNSYSYYQYSGDHVCSNNYRFNYDTNNKNAVINMCPCKPYEYYFTHTGYTTDENGNEVHRFSYNLEPNITFSLKHVMKSSKASSTRHLKNCIFFEYCNESETEQHYTSNNKYEVSYNNPTDPSNSIGHYMFCSECKYIKFYNHSYVYNDSYSSNDTHRLECKCCYYIEEPHHYNIIGDDLNHRKICQSCQYVYEYHKHYIHNLSYNYDTDTTHTVNCSCGFISITDHSFENSICSKCNFEHTNHINYNYDSNGKSNHKVFCFCGNSHIEKHEFLTSGIGMRCKYCGYFTTDPIIVVNIPINNELMSNNHSKKEESEEENE